jgi:hypothetical protein
MVQHNAKQLKCTSLSIHTHSSFSFLYYKIYTCKHTKDIKSIIYIHLIMWTHIFLFVITVIKWKLTWKQLMFFLFLVLYICSVYLRVTFWELARPQFFEFFSLFERVKMGCVPAKKLYICNTLWSFPTVKS